MKRTKRLLSLLTSTAIAASAFSALAIPASADEILVSTSLLHSATFKVMARDAENQATYTYDGETEFANALEKNDWLGTAVFQFSVDTSDADFSKTKSAIVTLNGTNTSTDKSSTLSIYATGNNDYDVTQLTVNDLYNLPETFGSGAGANVTINAEGAIGGVTKIADFTEIAANYSGTLTVDITDYIKTLPAGTDKISLAVSNSNRGVNISSVGSSAELQPKIDITIADEVLYNVNFKTNAYAKITINDGETAYADGSGNYVLSGLSENEEINYKIEKVGYTPYEGSLTVGTEDSEVSQYISPADSNVLFTEDFEDIGIVEKTTMYDYVGANGDSVRYMGNAMQFFSTGNGSREGQLSFTPNISTDGSYKIEFDLSGLTMSQAKATDTYWSNSISFVDENGNVIFGVEPRFDATTKNIGIAVKAGNSTEVITTDDISAAVLHITAEIADGKVKATVGDYEPVEMNLSEGTTNNICGIKQVNNKLIFASLDNIVVTDVVTQTVPTEAPTDEPDEEVEPEEYLNDNFDSYESTGVTAQGKTDQSAEMGNFMVYVGSRGSGGDGVSNVALENGAVKITSGNTATSSRGGSIALNTDAVTVPAYADLEKGAQINYTFDAKFMDSASTIQLFGITSNETSSGGQVVNDPYLSIANNSNLPLNEWVTVTASVKNDKSGYITIKNADGKIIYITEITATGDTFEKLACYGGVSTVYIDNFKVNKTAAEYGTVNVSVKTSDGKVIEGATVTIDGYKLTVPESGVVSAPMPAGEYTVSAERTGYEANAGMADADTETITVVKGGTNNVDLVLNLQEYTKLPDIVVINGGQTFIAAPKTAEPSTSAAFTVDVSDQMTLPMLPEEYELVWSIVPTGSEEADADVSIDSNGVVSVAQSFYTNDRIKSYDVSAAATANGRTTKVSKVIYVANSDVIYYEPTNWTAPSGERGTTTVFASATTLPDISSITFNMTFGVLGADGGSQRTWSLDTDADKLVGLQYTKDGKITAWTGWTGSDAMNQDKDVGAFTNSAELISSYTDDTPIEVTFVVDKQNKSITVSYGEASVSLPYTIDAQSITGMSAGMYRNYSQVDVADVIITEPDQNYLAITGDVDFAKVSGQTIEREYKLVESVIVPDEEFTWSLSGSANGTVTLMEANDVTFEITAPEADTIMYASKAVYNSDGTLKNLEIQNVAVSAGQASVTVSADEGTKVMLWKNFEKMEPAAVAQVATGEDIEQPTEAPPVTDAISISNDGVLKVTDEAEPGKYTITAVSSINPDKKAVLEIEIADFQKFESNEMELAGPRAYEYGTDTEGTYTVAVVVDRFGDDVTALIPDAVWTSSNPEVATITEDGHLTVTGLGTTNITATVTNGTAVTVMTMPVVVADFSFVADATGNSTTIDTSTMVSNDNITGYRVITAKSDGTMVSENVVENLPTTVDTTGADKLEIVPVFTYDIGDTGTKDVIGDGFYIPVPAASYNLDVTVSGSRCDIYSNDQMLVNNILQAGSSATEIMNDVVINDGVARITGTDFDTKNGKTSKDSDVSIKIVKSSSIVNRVPKVYVLGDSLVATYYNGGSASNASAQTGWGQVLVNYLNDTVEVNNLSNSGITANGLYTTAFSRVATSAQSGDYLVLESGYNDRTYDTEDVMKNALRSMIEVCKEKGVNIILVSPNASLHTYNQTVSWTSRMEAVVEETGTPYIDLSDKSWSFFQDTYGGSQEWFVGVYNVSDKLHSTYNGAMKWASVVAQGLYDLGYTSIIDTDYSYSFNDGQGNTIECTVNAE